MIHFDKEKHRYTKGARVYDSVTSIIKNYVEPFDRVYWSTYKACKDTIISREGLHSWNVYKEAAGGWTKVPDYYRTHKHRLYMEINLKRSLYLDKWDKSGHDARTIGTAIHSSKEKSILGSKQVRSDISGIHISLEVSQNNLLMIQEFDSIHNNNVYVELIVSNDEFEIAGMVDKVEKHGKDVYIIDYKTSKEINQIAFMERKMKPPLQFIPDCNFNHYGIQLSVYGWMLEQMGFRVKGLQIQHLLRPDFSKMEPYYPEYRPDIVEVMLKDYRKRSYTVPFTDSFKQTKKTYEFRPLS